MVELHNWLVELREGLSDKAYALGWAAVKALPGSLSECLFNQAADVIARCKDFTQLRRNLARVIGVDGPEEVPDGLVRDSIRSYARYWREAFCLPTMNIEERFSELDISVTGKEHITHALSLIHI